MTLVADYTARLPRLVRFCAVGGICFLLGWSLLWLGTAILGWSYLVSTAVAFSLVTLFGHCGNRVFTFSATRQAYVPQLRRYALLTLASLALSLFLMWLLVDVGHLHYLLANACVAVLIAALNFSTSRAWVFGDSANP